MINKKLDLSKWVSVISLLIIFLVFAILTRGGICSIYNLSIILDQNIIMITACAGTIFVSSQGSTDLSIGVNLALSAVIGMIVYEKTGSGILMVLTILCIGLLMGAICGFIFSKFKVPSFMLTLAVLIGVRGVINYIQSIVGVSYAPGFILKLDHYGVKLVILLAVLLVMGYLLEYTRYGLESKAIGENETTAKFIGIPVKRRKILAFFLSGLTASIAAILSVARLGGTSTSMGNFFEIEVMTAIYVGGVLVTGGTGTKLYKAVVGSIIVTVVKNGLVLCGYSSSEVSEFVQGIILMLVLYFTIYFENSGIKVKSKLTGV